MPSVTSMVKAYKAQELYNTTTDRCKERAERAEALHNLLMDLRARDRVHERADQERSRRGMKRAA